MTNWKDVPHLFANGKFRSVYSNSDRRIVEFRYGVITSTFKLSNNCVKTINGCTLIARPISDISDEELHHVLFSSWGNPPKEYSIEWNKKVGCVTAKFSDAGGKPLNRERETTSYFGASMKGKTLLYLLSVGILSEYFFSTKDVIWRYENERVDS